jgi:hypothetical protein
MADKFEGQLRELCLQGAVEIIARAWPELLKKELNIWPIHKVMLTVYNCPFPNKASVKEQEAEGDYPVRHGPLLKSWAGVNFHSLLTNELGRS